MLMNCSSSIQTLKLPVLLAVTIVLAGCGTSRKELLATSQSQLQLRSIQTRSFDTTDREKTLRTIIATMQDLGFVIDNANQTLGSVSGTKLDNFQLRMTATVRPKGTTQLLVRANMQFNLSEVDDPEPYQQFFAALGRAMFLEAHMEEGSGEGTEAGGPKGASASATEGVAKQSKGATAEKASGIVEPKPLAIPQEAAVSGAITGVPDLKSIAGTWSGRIEFGPKRRATTGDGPLTMTIKEDGTYDAVSPNRSKGNVQVVSGKYQLMLGGEIFTLALEHRAGKRILKGSNYDSSLLCELTQEKEFEKPGTK